MVLANLSKREKSLFYLAVAIISLSLIFNFLLKPLGSNWRQLNSQIIDKEIKLKKNARLLQQKDKVKNVYAKYAPYIKRQGSDEEEISFLLNEVERQARASGIRIVNIRPKPIKDLEFYKKYIIEMNCEAPMEKYTEFIYNLQNSTQSIRVEKLKLTSQGKDNPLLKSQMSITKILAGE